MRKPYIYIIGIAMSLVPTTMWGQGTLSPRTAIILNGDKAPLKAQGVNPNDAKLTAFVTIDNDKTSWQALGILPMSVVDNTATVRLSLGEMKTLAQKEGVEYIQITSGGNQLLDLARKEAGTDDVHHGTTLPQPYTGKGVVVGVVDAGFDYTHSAFRNPETGELRIKRVWEQNKSNTLEGAKAPEKYGYGLELNTPELITASGSDCNTNSHGCHVAAMAAGSDSYKDGAYVGNAPDADIVLVALDLSASTSADILNGINYIFDYADEVKKPCVVNISLGNNEGPHDGTSTFDVMTDKLQGPGRLIVGAAGNSRTEKFHVDHSFNSADDAPMKTFINYLQGPSTYKKGGNIEIWGDKGSDFEVYLSAYSIIKKEDVVSTKIYPVDNDAATESEEKVTEASFGKYATGTWKVSAEDSCNLNGKTHIVLSSDITAVRSNYGLTITVKPKSKGRVNIWADNSWVSLTSKDIDGFTGPDANSSTVNEIGGTAKRILTVGAYTTRNEYKSTTAAGTLEETVGDLASFSSYGPTADGRIKPEVAAPGCLIISAVSSNDYSGTLLVADKYDKYDRTNTYGYMQGTSMASPFVAGIVATWLEAYPELTPEQLHEIVAETARKDSYTSTDADNNWGYGKINAMDGLKKCISMNTAGVENISNGFNGGIKIANGNIAISFDKDTEAKVEVANLAGDIVLSKDLGKHKVGECVNVPFSPMAKGIYVVAVKTTQNTKACKFVNK